MPRLYQFDTWIFLNESFIWLDLKRLSFLLCLDYVAELNSICLMFWIDGVNKVKPSYRY